MRTILKVIGLEKSFVDRKVLENIHFEIKQDDRIGLVGYNGTGKTTLAQILFGKLIPDHGEIELIADCKIGYLNQSIDYEFHVEELIDESLLKHMSELGLPKVYEWEHERLEQLSGGEKLKFALSQVWASKPDLLILDEPTNHLDYNGIEWLVSELEKFQGPVLIISHDRHFLDRTVNQIFELENRIIQIYNGNYSDFQKEKQHRKEVHRHQYNVQQRYKESIEQQMDQLKNWSDKAHRDSTKKEGFKEYHRVKAKKRDKQIKSKMKRLERELEKNHLDKPVEEKSIRFQFDEHGKRGKRVIQAEQLGKRYGQRKLFQKAQFYINHGERIGFIGENGCGKTTLIRMILGEEYVTDGNLWVSESLKIAYLSQDVLDLPEEKTAIEALGFYKKDEIYQARTYLANLGLKEELITKPISTLSLGERTRVKLVDMLMREYDVLILDEPTNHLDLPSREQLETTLGDFTGTIITVSHDYYFLNKLCDRLLVFEDQTIKRLEMTANEYFNPKQNNKNNVEALIIIENRIAAILGELSLLTPKDEAYSRLDQEFNELLKEKKRVIG